jgi:hypothetical protein
MSNQNTRNKERRIYGEVDSHYDPFLGGIFKSKHKKKKEKLDIKQRDANLSLTNRQNKIAEAKAQSELFKAQAEQMRAVTARKLAEKAETQLQGAKASTQLKYVGMAIGGIVVIGGVALAVYLVKQNKNIPYNSTKLAKIKAV